MAVLVEHRLWPICYANQRLINPFSLEELVSMATVTRFTIECGDEKHELKIDTVMIPDPDNPKSGKTIPAPRLTFLGHCSCPDPEHCCGDAERCEGQQWLESQMAYIKMTEECTPSCAQWSLEFSGVAPKRVERAWWSKVDAEVASGRK